MIVETTYLFLRDELKNPTIIVGFLHNRKKSIMEEKYKRLFIKKDIHVLKSGMYSNVVDNDTKIVYTVLITQNFVVH